MPRTSPEEQERARQEWADLEAGIRPARPIDATGSPAAFAAQVVEMARVALERGDRYFEAQIAMSTLTGTAIFGQVEINASRSNQEPDLLGRIEDVGWRLEKADYVFVPTGSASTSRFLVSGDNVAMSGYITGVYLFRRA